MPKFRKGLVKEVREEIQEKQKQERLHEKYQVDPNLFVVEKTNMAKFLIRAFFRGVRTAAVIIVAALAVIGLLAVLYPESRNVLEEIYRETIFQIRQYLQR